MFRWCSYCQRSLGESKPYDDYRLTHGICDDCVARLEGGDKFSVKGLQLFQELFSAAKCGKMDECRGLVDQAIGRGWKPSDVAIGLLQPGLYKIGRLWSLGKATVAEEHTFTRWCDGALVMLEALAPNPKGKIRVLLGTVARNKHTLGTRIVGLYLRDRGIPVRLFTPGLPGPQLAALCAKLQPRVLGLSVAQVSGLQTAQRIIGLIDALPRRPRVVLGGLAARSNLAQGFERAMTVADRERFL